MDLLWMQRNFLEKQNQSTKRYRNNEFHLHEDKSQVKYTVLSQEEI